MAAGVLVTNPNPGTYSEVTVAGFVSDDVPTSFSVTRFAKPTPDGSEPTEPVLPEEQMLEQVDQSKRVKRACCRATPGCYPHCVFFAPGNDKKASLDLELNISEKGRYVCKQVQEFGGR